MTLSYEIIRLEEVFRYNERISRKTKNQTLKEIIESYRKEIKDNFYSHAKESVKGVNYWNRAEHKMLEKILSKETTFKQEYDRVDSSRFVNATRDIFFNDMKGLDGLKNEMALLDKTIDRIYRKKD